MMITLLHCHSPFTYIFFFSIEKGLDFICLRMIPGSVLNFKILANSYVLVQFVSFW
jgi:hypothetical protein